MIVLSWLNNISGWSDYKMMPKKINIQDGVNFTVIKDDRFKTGRISVSMFVPLDETTVSQNAILPYIMIRSCKKYPDFTALNKRLAELYGVRLSADVDKIGEAQVLSIVATFLDDRYTLNDENVSNEVAKLLCDLIFNPNLENNLFVEDDFQQEKRQLIESIEAEYNDKKIFAKQKCIAAMCADEKFGINPLGSKESIQAIDNKQVFVAWENLLKQARFEILMLGESDPDSVLSDFSEAFKKIKDRNVLDCSAQIIASAEKEKTVTQTDDIVQCKLVMGLRTGSKSVEDDDIMAKRIMNALLGATPHSKLFLNVREKLSLCYYCVSKFDRNKGILTIESGVLRENIDAAVNEIKKQIEAIQNGDFSDEDLETTKLSIKNSYRTISDYPGGLENFYLMQTFLKDLKTPEQLIEEVETVMSEDVINAAKKLTIDTIFTLVNKE